MEKIRIFTGGAVHEAAKTQLNRWRRKYGQHFYYIKEMRGYVPVAAGFYHEFKREEWRQEKRELRRAEVAWPPLELLDWRAEHEDGTAADPALLHEQKELREKLHCAICALPAPERELLALCLAGLSERAIAARWGCSKTLVHKRKLELRADFRRALF